MIVDVNHYENFLMCLVPICMSENREIYVYSLLEVLLNKYIEEKVLWTVTCCAQVQQTRGITVQFHVYQRFLLGRRSLWLRSEAPDKSGDTSGKPESTSLSCLPGDFSAWLQTSFNLGLFNSRMWWFDDFALVYLAKWCLIIYLFSVMRFSQRSPSPRSFDALTGVSRSLSALNHQIQCLLQHLC